MHMKNIQLTIISAIAIALSACGKEEASFIEKACISEGTDVAECACMAEALQNNISDELYAELEGVAKDSGAQAVALKMMGFSEQEKHEIGAAVANGCAEAFEVSSEPEETVSTDLSSMTPDEAMIAACQVDGNTSQMCGCWAEHVKQNVSSSKYELMAQGAKRSGNDGLTSAVRGMSDEEQMSVGVVLMEAGTICGEAN